MTTTPEQARELLDGATAGRWQWDVTGCVSAADGRGWADIADYVSEPDAHLIVAAPDMAATIAAMTEEWGVRWDDCPSDTDPYDWGFPTRKEAEKWERTARKFGPGKGTVVRRYVTEPEEA